MPVLSVFYIMCCSQHIYLELYFVLSFAGHVDKGGSVLTPCAVKILISLVRPSVMEASEKRLNLNIVCLICHSHLQGA